MSELLDKRCVQIPTTFDNNMKVRKPINIHFHNHFLYSHLINITLACPSNNWYPPTPIHNIHSCYVLIHPTKSGGEVSLSIIITSQLTESLEKIVCCGFHGEMTVCYHKCSMECCDVCMQLSAVATSSICILSTYQPLLSGRT